MIYTIHLLTPIDREDIYNISNALFDMVDYGITTIEEMNILKVKTLTNL
jgi:uncharacterized protein Yka (UPF0111/DUF47 family)